MVRWYVAKLIIRENELIHHHTKATQMHGFIDRNYRRLCELSRWARCKKSYTALTSEQLSMSVGDVIEIRDREKANWWLGVNLSVAAHPEGWFPSDAVSVLPRLSQTPPEVFTDTSAAKNFTEYTPIPVTMLAGDESRTTLMSQLKTVLNPSNAGDVSSTIDSISSGAESKNIPQPRVSKKAAADHRKSIAQSTISESDPLHSDLASTTSSETKNKPAKLRRRSLLITSANGSVRTSVLGTMEGVSQTCDPLTSAQPEFIEALYQWAETQLRLSESSALGRFTGKEANTTPEMLQVRIRERLAYSKVSGLVKR